MNLFHLLPLLPLLTQSSSAAAPTCNDFLAKMPSLMTLHAPFTPFQNDPLRSLNATQDNIDKLAHQASSFGVTTIFVPGSMSQFDTMNMAERKTLMTAWIEAGHKHGLYVITHVGTSVQSEAIELALFAVSAGADAIGSVPSYYETTDDVPTILDFLRPIAAAAPELPLFYYHLPDVTHADIEVSELFELASGDTEQKVPTLCGVKWVGNALSDWFKLTQLYNDTRALLFAPEPKLASFSLGMGKGVVLAEDFYAPTYIRMRNAWLRGDLVSAAKEQAWKYSAEAVFGNYQNTPKRRVYEKFNLTQLDMGPGRLPQQCWDDNQEKLFHDLATVDFWKLTQGGGGGGVGVDGE